MKGLRRPASLAVSVAVHLIALIIASRLPVPMPPREAAIAVQIVAATPAESAPTGSPQPAEEAKPEPEAPAEPEPAEPEPERRI